tara:strand:- start:8104 stop:8829 length:726 start_codon:yes stop_codon:yes gene_type:complete
MSSAGILIIGNEILSGKVSDTNSPFLFRNLRKLGVDVQQMATILDEVTLIGDMVSDYSSKFDFVFTSGGVGPTHDDVTMEGVAKAFGRTLEKNSSIIARIENAQGKPCNNSQVKMAMIPQGASLLDGGDLWFPVVILENVYIFPGIPSLLEKKFKSIQERFRSSPFYLKRVFVNERESDLASALHEVLKEFPTLLLGSYPKIEEKSFKVLLTLESRDPEYLESALAALLTKLPKNTIYRIE